MTAEEIIGFLNLEPLPDEGGYFRRTYEAGGVIPAEVLPKHGGGSRVYSTAIYDLVTPRSFSALHRLPQDEMFHFYLGDPVEMIQIRETGDLNRFVLGPDLLHGHHPQVIAPGGVWQGTRLVPGGKWALLGCTVAPGFAFADLEIRERAELGRLFPQHEALIRQYTHG